MQTRPLEEFEYVEIVNSILKGFSYMDSGVVKKFRPNLRLALIIQLQASLGLRIGDVMKLRVSNFKNGKLELIEEKTDKLQYRSVNPYVSDAVKDYALSKGLRLDDRLFDITKRAAQKQFAIVIKYCNFTNVGTHSLRKLFANTVYENSNHDIELVRVLLNHTRIDITQRYIRKPQKAIDEASQAVNYMITSQAM